MIVAVNLLLQNVLPLQESLLIHHFQTKIILLDYKINYPLLFVAKEMIANVMF